MMRKMLVVEDDANLRISYRIILEEEGYQVFIAADGIEALAMLQQEPMIELILSDGHMPYMDGYELLDEIKHNPATAAIRYILITGEDLDIDLLLADAYLLKPVEVEDLLLAVSRVLADATNKR